MRLQKCLVLVALAALLLSACSNAVEPTQTQAAAQNQPAATDPPATETSAPADTPTQAPPTDTKAPQLATATEESQEATQEPQPATQEPQPATDTPEAEDVFSFLQVGPDEWAHGPADAEVTIIEYADFQ